MPAPSGPSSPQDIERLLLQHAPVGLLAADMDSGRILGINPWWPELLQQDALAVGACVWDSRWWESPEVVHAAVSLGRYGIAMPPTRLQARHALGHGVPLFFSCHPVTTAQGRQAVCTLQALPDSPAPTEGTTPENALLRLVQTLSSAVEAHDPGSRGHQYRVAHLSAAICRQLGLPEQETRCTYLAALIHDLGKLSIPGATLGKKGMLTAEEARQIQGHVLGGVHMVAHIDFAGPVARLIEQHHERLNGSGYPAGLRGAQIEPCAQIIGIADTVEAMTRERPYQPAHSLQEALDVVARGKGILFSAHLVQACLDLFQLQGYSFPSP